MDWVSSSATPVSVILWIRWNRLMASAVCSPKSSVGWSPSRYSSSISRIWISMTIGSASPSRRVRYWLPASWARTSLSPLCISATGAAAATTGSKGASGRGVASGISTTVGVSPITLNSKGMPKKVTTPMDATHNTGVRIRRSRLARLSFARRFSFQSFTFVSMLLFYHISTWNNKAKGPFPT